MKKDLADSYYELGRMWKAKGDTKKAEESLTKALDIFKEVKVEKYIEKVKEELQECKE
jgi:hypothetical protein